MWCCAIPTFVPLSSLGVVLSRLAAAYSLIPSHIAAADLRRHDLISPPHLYPLCPHFPRFRGHLGDGGGKFGSAGRESRLPYPGLEQWLEYCPEGGISSLITCGPAPSASSHVVSHTPNPSLIPVQRSVSCPTQVASYPRGRSPMVGLTRKSSSPWLTGWSRRPAPPSTGCSTSSATVSGSSMLRRAVATWRENAWQPR
nr:uncharacterized protein LOC9266148 [Oryza sativa Japonica Group]